MPQATPKHGLATAQLAALCAGYLAEGADRAAAEFALPVFFTAASHFHLPEDRAMPLLMVGPGTGVAPFVGMVDHRRCELAAAGEGRAAAAAGAMELYFGCRHEARDFIYRAELEGAVQAGALSRLVTAFSRDTAEKVYVWHRMLEEGARVAELLLQQGGAIYVCGDGFGMAQDVDKALAQILREHGGQTADEATATLAGWKANGRYRRDIWS